MSKKTRTTSKSEEKNPDIEGSQDNQENVDKIRDILFGGHMRDYDKRFRSLEEHIAKENSRIRNDVSAKIDQLDNFIKQEFKSLNDRLTTERKERMQDSDDAGAALADARKNIENRIADVDEVHGAAAQEIRNRLHEQANEMLDMIRNNHEASETSLRTETRRLTDEKVAREDLAGLFTEVAMRLQREFDLPDDS